MSGGSVPKTVTFLELAPEFGGTTFGPFEGVEIRLGSDPAQNDITLPESLGVVSAHLKLLRQEDGSLILAPVDRAAPVYLFRPGTFEPKLVTSPTAIRNGDAFSLVTPEGPRFTLMVEGDQKAIAEAARKSQGPAWARNLESSRLRRGLIEEIRRRGFAAVVSTSIGNAGIRAFSMITTGQIFRPIYIVSGIMMLSGWLFAGTAACGALRFNKQKSTVVEDLSNCKDQLEVSGVGGVPGSGDPTVPDLTSRVLGDEDWKHTLEGDAELQQAYREQLKAVLAQRARYGWAYEQQASPYTRFKAALQGAGLPPSLVRVLAFAAVQPNFEREWSLVNDSEEEEVCGRGPLDLTFRQATNLGLQAQPDALVERQVAESGDITMQRSALDATVRAAQTEERGYPDGRVSSRGADIQGGMQCLYVEGSDDRTDHNKVADSLMRKLGPSATALPDQGEFHWIASRLFTLFAQDFSAVSLEQLDFDARAAPSVKMSTLDIKDSRRSFAIRSAARLMARATAVPCFARFDKDADGIPEWFLEQPPMLGNCAILKAYVEYNRLD